MALHLRHAGILAALILALAIPGRAQTVGVDTAEHFQGVAVNTGGTGRQHVAIVDLFVTRWSERADRDKLTTVLHGCGASALIATLRQMPPAGSVLTPDGVEYTVRYAWTEPQADGGRRIVLATDQPIGFWKTDARTAVNYPFTLIELRLNRNDEGEAKMSLTTGITARRPSQTIELAGYHHEPLRLMFVQRAEDE